MVKCTLCKRWVRVPVFPINLFFWRPKGYIYNFDVDIKGESYNVTTVLCPADLDYAENNSIVAQELIAARIHRIENE